VQLLAAQLLAAQLTIQNSYQSNCLFRTTNSVPYHQLSSLPLTVFDTTDCSTPPILFHTTS
jgi:hypothetical protein